MRIRITYKKGKPIRFTSALDMQSIWERTFRRASLKVSYSKGFRPKPKIQLGLPLPLGCLSRDEKVDIWLDVVDNIESIKSLIRKTLPEGIEVTMVEEIPAKDKPLVSQITTAVYHAYVLNKDIDVCGLMSNVDLLLNSAEVIRIKKNGRRYDLKPLIEDLNVGDDDSNGPTLFMKLKALPNATGRADEVILALGYQLSDFLIERISVTIK